MMLTPQAVHDYGLASMRVIRPGLHLCLACASRHADKPRFPQATDPDAKPERADATSGLYLPAMLQAQDQVNGSIGRTTSVAYTLSLVRFSDHHIIACGGAMWTIIKNAGLLCHAKPSIWENSKRLAKSGLVSISNSPRSINLEITQHPDACGPALAQVVQVDGSTEVLLGQAWLAAANRMVTCGHVVERFVSSPQMLFVIFPASGNRYQVRNVRLHPSFVRQPDGLVKFDVAVLEVTLLDPESRVQPLPFSFETDLRTNQTLGTIRYPVHLGQLSAALQPLTQEGRFLGLLRKHDNFHMLHDLPLSPGDSGSPLCSGNRVVAIHCGDTASLPGLNLPTTSIRLALWVDALRELGLRETRGYFSAGSPVVTGVVSALIAMIIGAIGVGTVLLGGPAAQKWTVSEPGVKQVQLSLNRPQHGYEEGEGIVFTLVPDENAYVWLMNVDKDNNVVVLFPPLSVSPRIDKGESRKIDRYALGGIAFSATPGKEDWHLIALSADDPKAQELSEGLLKTTDYVPQDPKEPSPRLKLKWPAMAERLKKLEQEAPNHVIHQVTDCPTPLPKSK